MALRHIAWLRFKDGVDAGRIEQHLAACRTLVGRVPAVINLECGTNTSDRAGGFTHGIVVSLAGREALNAYLEHPAHVPVADALKGDLLDLRVMDLEIPD
jgi:Stress responsive A/B Barrel Domain